MRVSVRCKEYGAEVAEVEVWRGDLSCIPRVDEYITVFDGFAAETVTAVDYMLDDGPSVILWIRPDHSGAYRNEVARRGLLLLDLKLGQIHLKKRR